MVVVDYWRVKTSDYSWWFSFNPFQKYISQIGSNFPRDRGEHTKILETTIYQKLNKTLQPRTPKVGCWSYWKLRGPGVRSVGPVGDFLDTTQKI